MNISFIPLAEAHFSLLLKWFETPHVKAWWDPDVTWTPALIAQKYADYVKGFKQENGVAKTIKAYIICVNNQPVGYIQTYNPHDFARSKPLTGLPVNLAAIDVLIGESDYLKQGIGAQAIVRFLDGIVADASTPIFVDPETANLAAIKTYKKAGFKPIMTDPADAGGTWMIRESAYANLR